jgi:hypothetical protein
LHLGVEMSSIFILTWHIHSYNCVLISIFCYV